MEGALVHLELRNELRSMPGLLLNFAFDEG